MKIYYKIKKRVIDYKLTNIRTSRTVSWNDYSPKLPSIEYIKTNCPHITITPIYED